MEEKRRPKRAKIVDEGSWDCSVCTYKNSPEAFKCEMCDVRKGTSTRKPRINTQLIAQQVAQQYAPPLAKKEKNNNKKDKPQVSPSGSGSNRKSNRPPRLKNIDRSSAQSMDVTVGGLTVTITDYKPKKVQDRTPSTDTQNNNTLANDSTSTTAGNLESNESNHHKEELKETNTKSLTNGEAKLENSS